MELWPAGIESVKALPGVGSTMSQRFTLHNSITRTAHSKALIVSGTGYDDDGLMVSQRFTGVNVVAAPSVPL